MSGAEGTPLSPASWDAPHMPAAAAASPPRGRLFRKYALLFVALVGAALLINSGFDFWFSYQENKDGLIRIQQEKAAAAATRIEEAIGEYERQIGWTTHAQWAAGPLDLRRQDYFRLLRQVPAITELTQLDSRGRECLTVSRLKMDVIPQPECEGADFSQNPAFTEAKAHRVWFSPVYFRKESEPYMTLAMAREGRNAGVTVAEINLKLIWDVITALKIGQGGYAYVVDGRGKLIAHPDISLVLRDTDLSKLPQVAAALASAAPSGGEHPTATVASNLGGRRVLTAHAAIAPLGWQVFVEVPLSEAFAPLYGAALRTLFLLAAGLVAATLVALFLARRMTGPIRQLQAGAERIGAGDLDGRIDIHTGDELEALAGQFNRMAGDLQKSYAELEQRVQDRTAELSESLDQQTATSEVLGVINASPGDLAPVFNAMLEKALHLCGGAFGILNVFDGRDFRAAAMQGVPAAFAEWRKQNDSPYGPETGPGRLLAGENVVHNVDLMAEEAYRRGDPNRRAIVDLGGARSHLAVAMRKDGALLGTLTIYRQEVRPFTDKQIALLQNFAAQAVIAMENARLITETREALEQQTATAEVLGVINTSPGDLAPVFDAILEKAHSLCGAAHGNLAVREGDQFRVVAVQGMSDSLAAAFCEPFSASPGSPTDRLLRGEGVLHIPDAAADHGLPDSPRRRAAAAAGWRTALFVPLRRDDTLLGFINASRLEVRPFSEKQIALLQNFAAQAVIAMENARLITETRDALEQQTATAEVLGVINSSPGDLAPVFDAMLEKAMQLCETAFALLMTWDGERFHRVAFRGVPEDMIEAMRQQTMKPLPGTFADQFVRGDSIIHIPDLTCADPSRVGPGAQALLRFGARTQAMVALRKDGQLLGAIVAYRTEVRPFTDKQIALLQNFAAQAVIAMENARLIAETREALEQQTATAEVLGVINASPGDLAPVFDAMLEKAVRLCGGFQAVLWTIDGQQLRVAGTYQMVPEFVEQLRRVEQGEAPPPPQLLQIQQGERLVHVANVAETEAYRGGHPTMKAAVEKGHVRTVIWVALLKDNVAVGAFAIARREVRPFTDKQIALLQNFAAQAVIAMENARLIAETREALEQQTATAEVLGVINSSPGDLVPVFDNILAKATTLCEAEFGVFWSYDGERMRAAALQNAPAAFAAFTREGFAPLGDGPLARLIAGDAVAQVLDAANSQPSRAAISPLRNAFLELGGPRTVLFVALRKDEVLLGALMLYRPVVRGFSEKQITLVANFAAQAVIAMENARLITETREALEQQTATAEVLGVINSSPGDLAPVFDAMLEKAMRLCDAAFGVLNTYDGEHFRSVATRGVPPAYAKYRAHNQHDYGPGTIAGRVLAGERILHTPDLKDTEPYRTGVPSRRALVDLGGARASLVVALVKDGTILGFINIYRQEVRPFTDKQIALLQNFAAQAVIAMENARLITETREALDQQTATAEVLGVINSSPGDLAPVFDAILEKAHGLCGIAFGSLQLYEDGKFRAVALRAAPDDLAALLRQPIEPKPGVAAARLLGGERFVQIDDLALAAKHLPDDPRAQLSAARGLRTGLFVPLRREAGLLGYISAFRDEVRPFSDKEIALLENFAAQAVIAIDNARLITETQEALEQQTATAEVLGVINSSPGDLAPVFDAMLDKAMRLCDAAFGFLNTYDGERLTPAAQKGVPPALADYFASGMDQPRPGEAYSRLLAGEDLIHSPDVMDEEPYRLGTPLRRAVVDLGGARTALNVALRKDGALLGVFTVYRKEVRPFTEKQVALIRNFAAQAVIAMENARLITETREALEQQTATAEVLGVINSSPGDLGPVFDAILEKAHALCGAAKGGLITYDGEHFRAIATRGLSDAYAAILHDRQVNPPGSPPDRLLQGETLVQIPDIRTLDFPIARAAAEMEGVRTILYIPLRKDSELLGYITAYRQEVRPFTDKQIALLQNFAAQAVIAMENARLLGELRSRTDDLGRSVEELKALSEVGQAVSSTLDLRSVLSTILNRSVALAGADSGVIFRYSRAARAFHFVEAVGYSEAQVQDVRDLDVGENVTGMGEAISHRAPLQIPDLRERPPNPLRDLALAAGYRSVLIVPLVGADRIMGATILQRRTVGEFPEATVRLMQTLASQSVLAIQNARLFREIADKSEELRLASQHKSQFLANMSHELRTPLNAILGYTELMADGIYGELAPRATGVLERVQNNGKHLLALINDVLDLSKIEAGQLALTLEDYALPDVVQSVVSATESLANTKGLKFTADIAPGLPMGRGDARRLAQVLLNLTGNAIKFTDEGEVAIAAAAETGHFVLTVRDTGPGIAAADQAKIFEEFQQVDNSNTRKKGGTGLGLAISKRMVEMQGGTISVASELGHGATFRVTLPIRVEDIPEELLGAAQ